MEGRFERHMFLVEDLGGAWKPRLRETPATFQWFVFELSPTVRSCPAMIWACHSGSRLTDRIVEH